MGTHDEWNSSADWYDRNMGGRGDALNRDVLRPLVLEMLGDTASLTIVDCGCGSGYLTAELAARAARVVGTDFSPAFLEMCRRKYAGIPNLVFVEHDVAGALRLGAGVADVVLAKMVLQYVPALDTFAAEARRVLRPGGRLLVVVDHPFQPQFHYAQRLAGREDARYHDLGDYFDATPRRKLSLWGQVELTWYPRTVEGYLQPFLSRGFRLSQVRELPEERDGVKIPRILAAGFERDGGPEE